MALRQQGHSCQIAELGEQALAFARQTPYDIIVLDVNLPDIDGFEVIERLKWEGIKIPVLLESGLPSRDLASEGAVLGVDEFLAKPFNIAELIARMEKVVARAEQALAAGDEGGREPEGEGPERAPESGGAEQRRHERTAMFGAALIMVGDEPIPCVILDVSTSGAALRLTEADQQCPTLFTLEPLNSAPRRCELRWRRDDTLGVEFV
jgi:DNA-binding response OmpR family regulator